MAEAKIETLPVEEVPVEGPRRTVGATTNAAGGGNAVGGAASLILVWILTSVLGMEIPESVVGAITVLMTLAGVYVGGYLSPSKVAEVNKYLQENTPTAEDIALETSRVVLSAQAGAPVVNPKAVVINIDDLTGSQAPSGASIADHPVIAEASPVSPSEGDSGASEVDPTVGSWQ